MKVTYPKAPPTVFLSALNPGECFILLGFVRMVCKFSYKHFTPNAYVGVPAIGLESGIVHTYCGTEKVQRVSAKAEVLNES